MGGIAQTAAGKGDILLFRFREEKVECPLFLGRAGTVPALPRRLTGTVIYSEARDSLNLPGERV